MLVKVQKRVAGKALAMRVGDGGQYIHALFLLLFLLSGLVLPAKSETDVAPEVTIRHREQGGFQLSAHIKIAAPVAVVWDILLDCGQAMHYVPGIRRCEIVQSGENYDLTRHRVKPYSFMPAVDYLFHADYMHHQRVSMQLVEGNLREFSGEWLFSSCGEWCTSLSYEGMVEAAWFVPLMFERRALSQDYPKMLNRLRRLAEERYELYHSLIQARATETKH